MSAYPSSVKNFGSDVANGVDTVDAAHVNDLRAEVAAIETELGVNPSGTSTTVKDRLDALDGSLNAKGDMLKSVYDTDNDGVVDAAEAVPWAGITSKPVTYAPTAHASAHASGGADAIKLDDLSAPDDNTDLNVSTSKHGLMPKLPNLAAQFINGEGVWTSLQVAINLIIGDGVNAITSGWKADVMIPDDLEIVSATLLADASGSIVIDVKKATYANWPTVASIAASAKPTLSSAQKSQDSTLTGWTKTLTAGDVLEVVVDSAATVKQVTLALICKRR